MRPAPFAIEIEEMHYCIYALGLLSTLLAACEPHSSQQSTKLLVLSEVCNVFLYKK